MIDINKFFFELIRVALGNADSLSHKPSDKEWKQLYDMAKKQSLVGICFAAVQRLPEDERPPEMLYLTWMGMAAKIQQRNEVVNRQSVELQAKLQADGFKSCILKGQGVAWLYSDNLRFLRQSGDIDLWVDSSPKDVVSWARNNGNAESPTYLHVGVRLFSDTDVELHYRPTYCRCQWHNNRMQDFCENHKLDWNRVNGMMLPSWEFNVVYLLSHMYRHLLGLGIGLRQVMYYYFVLQSECLENLKGSNTGETNLLNGSRTSNLLSTLHDLGLDKFAGAVMYVLREVFMLDESYFICPVDEIRGGNLLNSILLSGNFGKMDDSQMKARSTIMGNMCWSIMHNIRILRYYPLEVLSVPVWKLTSVFRNKF